MADHRPGRSFPDPASSWFWRDRPEVPHSMRLLHSRCFEWNFRRVKPVTPLCSGWSKIRESSSWSAWPKEIPASASYCFFLPPERGGAFSNSWLHALFNLWRLQRMVWERSQALCSAVLRKSPEHPPLYIDSCRFDSWKQASSVNVQPIWVQIGFLFPRFFQGECLPERLRLTGSLNFSAQHSENRSNRWRPHSDWQ